MIFLFFICFLFIILFLPIRLKFSYVNNKFSIKIFGFNINLNKSKKKKIDNKKQMINFDIKNIKLVFAVSGLLVDIFKKIKIKRIFLKLKISLEDSYETIRIFNLSLALSNLIYFSLSNVNNIKDIEIKIYPDFFDQKSEIELEILCIFNVVLVLYEVFRIIFRIVKLQKS
ncbi:MAG: hypothetical protein CfP315_0816 [Candidatus Improbicoccus pseudotrichonymphae]|uniref:DUF2953 domain-containing protein n=1 Tax=Candidatus Improbicoccus pseudotrichonymphae TaxID=3033792 RepID=A0AA48I8U4_9FIRM|nr:MAG: hypothetical protein CfP315_0816 [Candidatus Improbicoccus pseudotrichonymphae]